MFEELSPGGKLSQFATISSGTCGFHGESKSFMVEELYPLLLAAKAAMNKEDYPTWWDAMKSANADDWWAAAKKEIETLEGIDAWEVVDRQDWMNVLPSTWAFRLKRYPGGSARKFKGRFCVRGDKQIEGVDFDET